MLLCAAYFERKKLNITELKKLVNRYFQYFQFTTKIIKNFLDFDIEVILRIKYFSLKGVVAAYMNIKYTIRVTSNNRKIEFNMCENCSLYVNFLLL